METGLNPRTACCAMRGTILVKPNLKLILLGALMIAVLHDVFSSGNSETNAFRDHQYRVSWLSDAELVQLINKVDSTPHPAGYMLISEAYQHRGDARKALYYLKKAEASGPLEDWED